SIVARVAPQNRHIRLGLTVSILDGDGVTHGNEVTTPTRKDMVQEILEQICGLHMGWFLGHFLDDHALQEFNPRLRSKDPRLEHLVIFLDGDPTADVEEASFGSRFPDHYG